jgi:hypothetical protein
MGKYWENTRVFGYFDAQLARVGCTGSLFDVILLVKAYGKTK